MVSGLTEHRDLFLTYADANSLIQYVATYLIHCNMTSQNIICPNHNPEKKFGTEFLKIIV